MELTFLRQEVSKLKSIVGEGSQSASKANESSGFKDESSKESESSEDEEV
jgi:hypothetical protein